jgi:hypothetical protein
MEYRGCKNSESSPTPLKEDTMAMGPLKKAETNQALNEIESLLAS